LCQHEHLVLHKGVYNTKKYIPIKVMALLLQCFSCTKPSYVDMDVDLLDRNDAYVSSHRHMYVHRFPKRLETIEEDIYENECDSVEGDDIHILVVH
jgi:hypothetical protein